MHIAHAESSAVAMDKSCYINVYALNDDYNANCETSF